MSVLTSVDEVMDHCGTRVLVQDAYGKSLLKRGI